MNKAALAYHRAGYSQAGRYIYIYIYICIYIYIYRERDRETERQRDREYTESERCHAAAKGDRHWSELYR